MFTALFLFAYFLGFPFGFYLGMKFMKLRLLYSDEPGDYDVGDHLYVCSQCLGTGFIDFGCCLECRGHGGFK